MVWSCAVSYTPPHSTPRKRKEPPASGSDSDGDRVSKSPPEKKRKGKHGKHASAPVQNGDSDVGKTDFKAWAFSEKRCLPKTDYNETTAHCPLPGCDSKGQFVLGTFFWYHRMRKLILLLLLQYYYKSHNLWGIFVCIIRGWWELFAGCMIFSRCDCEVCVSCVQ